MTQLLYTVPDAAQVMGISETTLWTLIRTRQIDSIAIPSAGGRGKRSMRRIERAVIDAFIAKHRQAAAT